MSSSSRIGTLLLTIFSPRKLGYTLLVLVGVIVITFFIRPPGDPARWCRRH